MGDADGLLLCVHDKLFIAPGNGLDGTLPSAKLGETDDLSLRVALQKRLDLQDRPDGGFQIGQAARPAQIAQIVNGKDLRHAVTQRAKRLIGFVDTHPFTAAVDRAHDKQTLAQRCAVGIDQKQFPVREFLTQLPRGNLTRGI